jgi:hypothetical protein
MADLQELYGDNHQASMKTFNQSYVADLAASNIAGQNFHEVRHDFQSLFKDGQMTEQWFQYIKTKVENMQPKFILLRIKDKNTLPYLINEKEITYMKLADLNRKKFYVVFITPYILDSY